MPRIIVTTDTPSEREQHAVLLTERVTVGDFESPHFQRQLIERISWAVGDADQAEAVTHSAEAGEESDCSPATPSPFAGQRDPARVLTTAS